MKKLFVFLLGGFVVLALASYKLWSWLPKTEDIRGCMITKMYQVELCPTSKNYVPLKQISPYLQKAIILTEDSDFYNHNGFDWDSIEKNAREGWETGAFKKGGSTITQQLAKNMYLSKDRTFVRKALEALITDRIEKTLTKKEILERYLNIVEFGKNVFGIKNAAQYYFKKSPAELNVVESAFLAMVLPNPVKYSSSFYRKELTPFARKRINQIIENMYKYHRISPEEYEVATQQAAYFLGEPPLEPANEVSEDSSDPASIQDFEEAETEEGSF